MIRELVALGVPHMKIKEASQIVLAAAGYATEGDFDQHSISRIVREGYVAAAMHVMWEVSEADCESVCPEELLILTNVYSLDRQR